MPNLAATKYSASARGRKTKIKSSELKSIEELAPNLKLACNGRRRVRFCHVRFTSRKQASGGVVSTCFRLANCAPVNFCRHRLRIAIYMAGMDVRGISPRDRDSIGK